LLDSFYLHKPFSIQYHSVPNYYFYSMNIFFKHLFFFHYYLYIHFVQLFNYLHVNFFSLFYAYSY
jgi:hypothetical protein